MSLLQFDEVVWLTFLNIFSCIHISMTLRFREFWDHKIFQSGQRNVRPYKPHIWQRELNPCKGHFKIDWYIEKKVFRRKVSHQTFKIHEKILRTVLSQTALKIIKKLLERMKFDRVSLFSVVATGCTPNPYSCWWRRWTPRWCCRASRLGRS